MLQLGFLRARSWVNAEAKVMQLSPNHKLTIFHTQERALTCRHVLGIEKQSQEINCFQRRTKLSSHEHLTYLCGTAKLLYNNSLASKHKNQ